MCKVQDPLRSLAKCLLCSLNFSETGYTDTKGLRIGYYVCNGKTSYRGKFPGKCMAKKNTYGLELYRKQLITAKDVKLSMNESFLISGNRNLKMPF